MLFKYPAACLAAHEPSTWKRAIETVKASSITVGIVMNSLPPDNALPPEIGDASAWYGQDLKGRADWIERLSEGEIAEVESAARELAESTDLTSISSDDFPLPTLSPRLGRFLEEVLSGRGFVLIKALPVERWTKREAAVAFSWNRRSPWRLAKQNADGHMLGAR